jgi:hypothetical protein
MSTQRRKFLAAALIGLIAVSGPPVVGTTSASANSAVFNNTNGYGVTQASPMPPAYTLFTITRPETITSISTYHWDNGRGAPRAGVIYILVPHSGGLVKAQAQAQGSAGQGGVPNANWTATFNVTLSPGQWQVWDSSPTTWSYNSQSANAGFANISGNPATSAPPTFRPCFYNTYSPLEMGPCSGPKGTTITIAVVLKLHSPLVKVMFANGTARVVIRSLAAKGVTPGSFYKFPAPAQLCLAGHGTSTWKAYAWDANGVSNPKYSQYGDEGNFGEFTITGC